MAAAMWRHARAQRQPARLPNIAASILICGLLGFGGAASACGQGAAPSSDQGSPATTAQPSSAETSSNPATAAPPQSFFGNLKATGASTFVQVDGVAKGAQCTVRVVLAESGKDLGGPGLPFNKAKQVAQTDGTVTLSWGDGAHDLVKEATSTGPSPSPSITQLVRWKAICELGSARKEVLSDPYTP